MSSRWVEWRGKYWERWFFEPPPDLPSGACPHCGDLGLVPEQIDEERFDVAVPCQHCRMFCRTCRDWVRREGHTCKDKP